jgi:hypothetical protein
MMARKFWILLLFLGVVTLALAGVVFVRPIIIASASGTASSDQAVSNPAGPTGTYMWSYAAKFVCGYQPAMLTAGVIPYTGEPVVKPGNYATDINIQNPNFKEVPLLKRVIVLVEGDAVRSEPQVTGPTANDGIALLPDSATMDGCNHLWTLTHPQGTALPTPLPQFIGYLVILSPLDLNVNVVYTSNAPGIAGQQPVSNSIAVQAVTGKRVFLPAGVTP